MAGYRALAAAVSSVVDVLKRGVQEAIPPADRRPGVVMIGTTDLDRVNLPGSVITYPSLAVFCYRLSVDRETRPGWSAVTTRDGVPRLPVCMHLLVTAFDEFVENELEWMGLAARILESDSLLAGPLLAGPGVWRDGETVQIVPDDMALESMSEAFQALTADFRLYLLYQVRVIVIEGRPGPVGPRVATVGAGLEAPA